MLNTLKQRFIDESIIRSSQSEESDELEEQYEKNKKSDTEN